MIARLEAEVVPKVIKEGELALRGLCAATCSETDACWCPVGAARGRS